MTCVFSRRRSFPFPLLWAPPTPCFFVPCDDGCLSHWDEMGLSRQLPSPGHGGTVGMVCCLVPGHSQRLPLVHTTLTWPVLRRMCAGVGGDANHVGGRQDVDGRPSCASQPSVEPVSKQAGAWGVHASAMEALIRGALAAARAFGPITALSAAACSNSQCCGQRAHATPPPRARMLLVRLSHHLAAPAPSLSVLHHHWDAG